MKQLQVCLLMLLVTSVILSGCDKEETTPTNPSTSIKVGSKWVYKYTQFSNSGTVTGTTNVQLVVTAEQTINGERWWVLTQTGTSTPVIIRKAATGWFTFKNNTSQLQFKVPGVLNDAWRVTYSSSAGDYSDFSIKSVSQSLTVPGGTFNVYYAEGYDSNSLENKIWYDETHSLIKEQEFDEGPGGIMYIDHQLELVSYNP